MVLLINRACNFYMCILCCADFSAASSAISTNSATTVTSNSNTTDTGSDTTRSAANDPKSEHQSCSYHKWWLWVRTQYARGTRSSKFLYYCLGESREQTVIVLFFRVVENAMSCLGPQLSWNFILPLLIIAKHLSASCATSSFYKNLTSWLTLSVSTMMFQRAIRVNIAIKYLLQSQHSILICKKT